MQPKHKIAISGAGGFLGREAIDFFGSDSSVVVHALYSPRRAPPPARPGLVPFIGDLLDTVQTRKWLTGCDAVIHLAERGYPAEPFAEAEGHATTNLSTAARLIAGMKDVGIKRLIYTSSGGALYRGASVGTLDEHSPLMMRTPYAVTKYLLEKRFMDLAEEENWKVSILRVSNPYGIHQIGRLHQGIIGAAIEKLYNREVLPLWAPLATAKDFLAVHDVSRAFQLALRNPVSGIFNIGSGHGTTLHELFATLEKVSGRKLQVKDQPIELLEAERVALECTLAKKTWGWKTTVSLEEGIDGLWRHRLGAKLTRVA